MCVCVCVIPCLSCTTDYCMYLCVDFTMLDEQCIMDSDDEFEILM